MRSDCHFAGLSSAAHTCVSVSVVGLGVVTLQATIFEDGATRFFTESVVIELSVYTVRSRGVYSSVRGFVSASAFPAGISRRCFLCVL